jgi:hypothetical protein
MSKNACIYLGDVHDGIKVDIADATKKSDDSGNPFRKTNGIKFLRLVKDNLLLMAKKKAASVDPILLKQVSISSNLLRQ